MRKIRLLIVSSLLILVLIGCNDKGEKAHLERTEFLMNTLIEINIYGTEDEVIMNKVYDRLFEIEKTMSKTVKDSDIFKINSNSGKEVKVKPETYKVLEEAIYLAEKTEGTFDPTIGPLVNLWDINESKEDRNWIPKEIEIEIAKELVDFRNIEMLEENTVRLKEKGMEIDLGGIVKGFAADEITKILKQEKVESAILDLGGDLYAYGKKMDNTPWKIGIQNPEIEGRDYMGILSIQDKSIVTSGNYERYFELNGEVYHHIIDKNTGYPSNNELASVTIVSDKGIDGDSYSTAFYILGIEKSLEMLKDLDGIDGIFITKGKKVHITDGIRENFQLRDDKSEFTIID